MVKMRDVMTKGAARSKIPLSLVAMMLAVMLAPTQPFAQEGDQAAELAKKLANPVANLISVPLQYNYDENYGPQDKGSVHRLNIQPVIPFELSENWNIITRTIVPLLDQNDVPTEGVSESGLGDIVASQFFSPKKPTAGGWIWGVGPAWLLPTATDTTLGSEKWGIGPTAVGLKQQGPWTFGMLANHIWSFAGKDDRRHYNVTFLQPFLAYITKTKTTLTLNTESAYDWGAKEWSMPINFVVSQLLKIGEVPFQLGVGARYWADSPDNGPEGWGVRAQLTFLFPK
jgi:hypothetical protein